jgi:hypothetical protein
LKSSQIYYIEHNTNRKNVTLFEAGLSFINTMIKMTVVFPQQSIYNSDEMSSPAPVLFLVFLLMKQTVVLLQQFSILGTENI